MSSVSLPYAVSLAERSFSEQDGDTDIIAATLRRLYAAENHHAALELGLQEVVQLAGARRGVLLIRSRRNNDMYPLFTYGGGLTHSYKFTEFGGLTGVWVLSWPQAEAAGWSSLPLKSFGDVVGAIYLDRVNYTGTRVRQKQTAVEILTYQLALILAVLVENSELAEIAKEKQASLEMLTAAGQIGQRLNASLDMNQAMTDFIEACRFLLDAEQCSVLMVNFETERLQYWGDRAADKSGYSEPTISLHESIAGWVVRTGEAALVLDVPADSRHSSQEDVLYGLEMRQLVCVPLNVQGRILGVIEVVNKLNGDFDELDLSLLQLLATSAAIAIENVQRYTVQQAEVKQKAELYSVASHGLRSPLMSIITWLDWILETGVQNDLHKARLEDIRSQTFNLSRFVGEILDMSRIEVGNIRIQLLPVAIVPFVKKSIALFELRAPTHRFEVQVTGPIPPVRADETQLTIVLDHLLENAVKYSPAGSLIQIKVSQGDDCVTVSICDQGPGIPADEVKNLFTRFYRGRQQQSSTGHSLGLGLYISKKLIEAQGGEIWVESESGQGSKFTFTLARELLGGC